MTTTHKIQKTDDGAYIYRGHRIDRRKGSSPEKRYGVGWIMSIKDAPTLKAIAANIDAYIAAEEKARKPLLRSDGTYCSPRCGYKCTKAAHDEAQRLGKALAKRMGPGWAAHIWENCMWNYSVRLDIEGIEVSVHHGNEPGKARDGHREGLDEYTCYLNTNPQFIAKHADPRKAFNQARQMLALHIANLREVEAQLASRP